MESESESVFWPVFQIQISNSASNSDFSVQIQLQTCCSDLLFIFVARIDCSDWLLNIVAQMQRSYSSDVLFRFVAQIRCSDSLFRFVAQICCSDLLLSIVSSYFNVQFQISNVHIQMQHELLLWFQTQFQIQSPWRLAMSRLQFCWQTGGCVPEAKQKMLS